MTAVLGQRDPLAVPPPASFADVCSAISDVPPGALAGFICTRAPGHVRTEPEHVASGDYPPVGDLAIAAWIDGAAPRVIEDFALYRAVQAGQS